MKIVLRKIVAFIIYYSGLIHVVSRRKKRAVILGYHRISDKGGEDYAPGMSVKKSTFEKHLKYIRRHLRAVGVEELISHLQHNEDISDQCAVTFDDGWNDNYECAHPVLKRYEIPATIFLATNFVDSVRIPWFEKVARLLSHYNFNPDAEPDRGSKYTYLQKIGFWEILSTSKMSMKTKIASVLQEMKKLNEEEIIFTMREIEDCLKMSADSLKESLFLSWDKVREMGNNGICFGSHTLAHLILTSAGQERMKEEVRESKKVIENRTKRQVLTFSYPNGNYTYETRSAVQEAGYKGAITSDRGYVSNGDDPFLLKRILLHEDICSTVPLFACRIEGVPFL